jgi:hypothetical protein
MLRVDMNPNYTRSQRRRLREVGRIAYEKDLSAELAKVEAAFTRWRTGETDAFELSETIHRFHAGPSQELFSKYDHSNLDWAVAHAIHRGVISAEEAGADLIEFLEGHFAFLRAQDPSDAAARGDEADAPLPR